MPKSNVNNALLPSGFADGLAPHAEYEARAIATLMQNFASFGYERIKPPLVEFEESLFAPGPGASLINETFRLMDPLSHKMMGVRSDITAQIARIATTRLSLDDAPIRLSYANDVLRTKTTQQRLFRQFCQVGCEIIGNNSVEADIEACTVGMAGLRKLGFKAVTVDIAMPSMLGDVLQGAVFEGAQADNVSKALKQRDKQALKAMNHPVGDVLHDMLDASGGVDGAFEILGKIDQFKPHLDLLKAFYNGLKSAAADMDGLEVLFTLDALEDRLLDYHTGVAYTFYASGVKGELGRGGRYKILSDAGHVDASGFTLYMDTVNQGVVWQEQDKILAIAASEPLRIVMDLQEQGWIVLRMFDEKSLPKRATHVYKDGEIKDVS